MSAAFMRVHPLDATARCDRTLISAACRSEVLARIERLRPSYMRDVHTYQHRQLHAIRTLTAEKRQREVHCSRE